MLFVTFLAVFAIFALIEAAPYNVPLQGNAGGKRTLVIFDDLSKWTTYSLFFHDLTLRGHSLTFQPAEGKDFELKHYGEKLYDNIILMAPSAEKFQSITYGDLSEFVEEGGNLLITANKESGAELREFAEGFGVTFDQKGSEVIDHFEVEKSLDKTLHHTVFKAHHSINSKPILGSFNGKAAENPVLFKGISHSIPEDNILGVKILLGNPTSYSFYPNKNMNEAPFSAGTKSVLVSGIQGRNNARVLIAGSIDMFSNEYFATNHAGNRQFIDNVSRWVLCESGVLRFRDITHHKLDGTPPDVILHEKERPDLPITLYPDPEITRNSLVYRIKDDIVYSMVVEELTNNDWKPFHADDMQMEFVMLDPYVRKTMTADKGGRFTAQFVAPDNYGVFKFRVLYRRLGYSILHAETQVSIRPFKHNEYERFILSAYPYYTSAFSAMFALFILSVFFLFSKDKDEKQD